MCNAILAPVTQCKTLVQTSQSVSPEGVGEDGNNTEKGAVGAVCRSG